MNISRGSPKILGNVLRNWGYSEQKGTGELQNRKTPVTRIQEVSDMFFGLIVLSCFPIAA